MRTTFGPIIFFFLFLNVSCGIPQYPYYGLNRLDGFRDVSNSKEFQQSVLKYPNATAHKVVANNQAALDWYIKNEWCYNKNDKLNFPIIGLAMSGGGIRSATFNVGVMSGLSEIGILDNIDIMSSVSGGSYAMSWYYLQQFYSGHRIKDTELFNENGKYQRYLEKHGELLGHTNNPSVRRPEYVIKSFPSTLISWPVNLISNGLFGWHLNVSPVRWMYQNGIERNYHLVPKNMEGDTLNDFSILSFRIGVDKQAEFTDLGHFVKRNKLPYFIINTTARIEDPQFQAPTGLVTRIFEFTPLRYGSDYYGYQYESPNISVNKAVSISGAAFDSNTLIRSEAYQILLSAANIDLGYYIYNYRISTGPRILNNLLPFPFYPFSGHHQRDIEGTDIYLTDGGHSDNLGAYSLVKRLPQNIIIVDAEYDPVYQFQSYTKLKDSLKSEMNVDLVVEDIDDLLKKDCCKGETIKNPVMFGSISTFPIPKDGKIELMSINVIYIKLLIDPEHAEDESYYNHNVVQAYLTYKNEKIDSERFTVGGQFPQQATGDLSFTSDQYLGYRDLGKLIVTKNKEKICEKFSVICQERKAK